MNKEEDKKPADKPGADKSGNLGSDDPIEKIKSKFDNPGKITPNLKIDPELDPRSDSPLKGLDPSKNPGIIRK